MGVRLADPELALEDVEVGEDSFGDGFEEDFEDGEGGGRRGEDRNCG